MKNQWVGKERVVLEGELGYWTVFALQIIIYTFYFWQKFLKSFSSIFLVKFSTEFEIKFILLLLEF